MRELEWENMGVKVDGWQVLRLRFADDIGLITPIISHAERIPIDFDRVCKNVGLQLTLTKTMFVKNERVLKLLSLNGRSVSEHSI